MSYVRNPILNNVLLMSYISFQNLQVMRIIFANLVVDRRQVLLWPALLVLIWMKVGTIVCQGLSIIHLHHHEIKSNRWLLFYTNLRCIKVRWDRCHSNCTTQHLLWTINNKTINTDTKFRVLLQVIHRYWYSFTPIKGLRSITHASKVLWTLLIFYF